MKLLTRASFAELSLGLARYDEKRAEVIQSAWEDVLHRFQDIGKGGYGLTIVTPVKHRQMPVIFLPLPPSPATASLDHRFA